MNTNQPFRPGGNTDTRRRFEQRITGYSIWFHRDGDSSLPTPGVVVRFHKEGMADIILRGDQSMVRLHIGQLKQDGGFGNLPPAVKRYFLEKQWKKGKVKV